MIRSSITDNPRNISVNEKDNFGIEPFEKGLTEFINNSSTPITIALQGEWGSGKTSLMNSLKKNLSDNENSLYHAIWINTWEYALMKDAQSTLMDIINGLVKETSKIAKIDETKTKKLLNTLWSGLKDTSKIIAKNALDKTIDGAGSIVDSFNVNDESSISLVRSDLESIIDQSIQKDKKNGFVFFIDDLDRVDPPVAVQLLELLKNIFTLNNCVFVLAIDYDVVIKGLEPKFGKLSELNEREFRSFFDKIIQVPFSMPVSSYHIDKFLKESLLSTNYISEKTSQNIKLISKFSEFSNLTVGKNPRALKRLINSLSLIKCINSAKDQDKESDTLNEELELLVNFALVSIQIAYPPVYRLLSLYPDFENWNENVALQMNLKSLDSQSIEKLNQAEEFDEDWEKVLFRLCENDHYLKKRALYVSRLLNSLKSSITDAGEDIENVVGSVIMLSSVTNLEAFDKPVVDYHKGNFLKKIKKHLIPQLKQDLPEIASLIKQQGTRVQSNVFIKFTEKDWGHWIKLRSHPYEGRIRLIINSDKWITPVSNHHSLKDAISTAGFEKEFDEIESNYNNFISRHRDFEASNLLDHVIVRQGNFVINLYSYLILPSIEDFYTDPVIKKLSSVISDMYPFLVQLEELKQKLITFYKKA